MNRAVIRIITEKTIENARRISSSTAGMGRMRTARMITTPTASPALDWRMISTISLMRPKGPVAVVEVVSVIVWRVVPDGLGGWGDAAAPTPRPGP